MKLVYDTTSVPENLGIANMIKIFEQHRVVFWNSDKGIKPVFYSDDGKTPKEIAIVDTTGQEIDFEMYQREFDEYMFWDKEIHNCKNSPIYYFTNYATTEYPATNEGTRMYLKSIGLVDINVSDSSKATKAWEKQKDIVKEAMKDISMFHLKERKAAVDIMKSNYEGRILDLEKELKDVVILFNAKGEPLEAKKRISNIVSKIKFLRNSPQEEWKTYRNKKRKWDTAMLYNTNYDILLQLLKDVHGLHKAEHGKQ